jgi:hypothetical protein
MTDYEETKKPRGSEPEINGIEREWDVSKGGQQLAPSNFRAFASISGQSHAGRRWPPYS